MMPMLWYSAVPRFQCSSYLSSKYYGLDVVTTVFRKKLKTTAVVRNDYGFTLGWGCTFFGNHLIMFGLFLDELMGLSQYR